MHCMWNYVEGERRAYFRVMPSQTSNMSDLVERLIVWILALTYELIKPRRAVDLHLNFNVIQIDLLLRCGDWSRTRVVR